MLTTGLMVFLGVALILVKLPRRLMLKALHHDLALDLTVSALTLAVHWGPFSGVMALSDQKRCRGRIYCCCLAAKQ